jgi:pimeloyl-ACP methyl ester carboxylesterase
MTQFVLYKKIKIAYQKFGSGPTIVFLHGFLENQKMWAFYTTILSKNYTIITIDLLGHGQTESLGYVHTMEQNAEAVLSVLNHLNLQKASFVGHSMGGYIALAFAEKNPLSTTSLVLLNSTAFADSNEKKLNRDRAIKVVKKDYETFVKMSIANLFAENSRKSFEAQIEITKSEALKTPLQSIISSLEGMKIRPDRSTFFAKIKIPKLLILGKDDTILNYQENILQTKNSDIEVISLSGGHMSHIENQIETLHELESFFSQKIS